MLGTTFDVRAWPGQGQDETQVTVVMGRVRVAGRKAGSPAVVLARPGAATRVGQASQQPTAPRPAVLDHVLAWRRGGFAVTDRPLAFIFAELERRFGIEIAVRVPLAETGSLTLFFPQPTHPEVILNDICTAKGLRYEATSHGFAVFRP